MKYFIVTIFCNLLSLGHLQETTNGDDFVVINPEAGKGAGGDWPHQTYHTIPVNYYGQAQNLPLPCSRRSNSDTEPIDQQSSPTLTSKVDKSLTNDKTADLMPQALKNRVYNLETTKNYELLSNAQLNYDDSHSLKAKKSLPVSNPVIDSMEESHHEIIIPSNKEIHEDELKPKNQFRSASSSDYDSASINEVRSAASRDFHSTPPNEYGVEPDNSYISSPSNLISAENIKFPPRVNHNFHSAPNPLLFSSPTSEFIPVRTHTLPSVPVNEMKIHSELKKSESPVIKPNHASTPNKCSHGTEPDDLIGHSRRSMSSYNDDNTARDNLNNGKELLQNNDDIYTNSRIDNENAMASVLNVEANLSTQKPNKDISLRILDKSKSPIPEKSVSRVGRPQFNEARREMMEPTRSSGVTNMGQSSLMMMQTERICYACSTANNPTCWAPDRRTTVKYCRKGNNACITKTFGSGSSFTLIRDCGKSCDDSEMGGLMPRYKSCSMCHKELCNGAESINGHSIICALFLIALIKYFN